MELEVQGLTPPQSQAMVYCIQGLAGGVGATNFAINLAWELASLNRRPRPRVCLIDLDLQHGAVATYLDLKTVNFNFAVAEGKLDLDSETFSKALQVAGDRLNVLAAPADLVPYDLLTSAEIMRLISLAQDSFDYIILDLPRIFMDWTEDLLGAAQIFFFVMTPDMRSAANAARALNTLRSESTSVDSIRFVLNRSPSLFDLSGKSRLQALGKSKDLHFRLLLPDGGRKVQQSNDLGLPLSIAHPSNPLNRAIRRFAEEVETKRQQKPTLKI